MESRTLIAVCVCVGLLSFAHSQDTRTTLRCSECLVSSGDCSACAIACYCCCCGTACFSSVLS
jgi:hypothetical protein